MSFIIFVMAASFSFRNAASAALGCRESSWAEAREAEPMANPAAVITAAATSEVTNSFLLFKIRAFESRHLNLIVSPSKNGADELFNNSEFNSQSFSLDFHLRAACWPRANG